MAVERLLLETGDLLLLETGDALLLESSTPGGTTHDTTGALIGAGSTVAGSSARMRAHPASGALIGQGSVVAGSAAHIAVHGTSGVLTGPGSVIVGTAARVAAPVSHDTSGDLVGPGSNIAGTADHTSPNTQTGGGVPNWSHRKAGETEEQKRTRREAQGIIAKARRADADIDQLAEQAKPIAALLKADVERLERAAESYKAEIGKQATKRLMNARNDALATRQLEQKLIASQLQAEQQAQQLEELDMVFIIALVAMEDES